MRENINKHEGDSDQKTKPGLSTEKSCDPPEIRPLTKFSLSENVSCLNKAIEFSQVGIEVTFALMLLTVCNTGYQEQVLGPL